MKQLTFLIFCLLTCTSLTVRCQAVWESKSDSIRHAHQKDLIDVYHSIFKHSNLQRDFQGKFHNAPFPAAGYTLQTGFAAVLSDNLAFYTGNPATSKLSSFATSFTYSQYNQTIIPILGSVWTKNGKFNFITDWRYMKYPSTTFGLGGHTLYSDGYTIDFSYIKLHTSALINVKGNLFAGLGYYYDQFWQIREVNPPPTGTSFEKYGLTYSERASGPAIRVLYDSRRNSVNPDGGFFANIIYRVNTVTFGSQNDWTSLQADIRKYIRLSHDGRHLLALWSFDWLSLSGKTPYLLLPSTGWDDNFNTGRGYIQGRYRGAKMWYLEGEYRFPISSNGLFGGVVFANAESFSKDFLEQIATSTYAIAPGYGVGVRIKLNKVSGANICVDYGWGLGGSQGVAVNLGEVF